MHAHEMHANEMYACDMHAYKVQAHESYARDMHVHDMHARKVHGHETPAHQYFGDSLAQTVVDLSRSEFQNTSFCGNVNSNNARSRMSQVLQFRAISFLTLKSRSPGRCYFCTSHCNLPFLGIWCSHTAPGNWFEFTRRVLQWAV